MLFDGNFYLGLLKIILQNLCFFYMKKLFYHFFVTFLFEVKTQNEPIAVKQTHKSAIAYVLYGTFRQHLLLHFFKEMW